MVCAALGEFDCKAWGGAIHLNHVLSLWEWLCNNQDLGCEEAPFHKDSRDVLGVA